MHATTRIETIGAGGSIHLRLNKPAEARVRVNIEDRDSPEQGKAISEDQRALARLQQPTGFASNMLGSAAEDAWNDL
jgi:hypothetical protein